MNEQFFHLPEEKQQAIINASLEVFATHEYKRASTDDIAAKAGISKGLLFYYFHNKKNLYLYIYDYTKQIVTAQVVDAHFKEITDFFELLAYSAQKKAAIMSRNPYLMDFVMRCFYPEKEEVSDELNSTNQDYIDNSIFQYFKNVDFSRFRQDADPQQILRMLLWMADGYISEKRRQGKPFVLDEIMHDFKEWSDMFRRLSYREEYL
ncbi:TetR/AcrR family transcriptional regulator [Eisenbergiella porci]|uniref:TetR/AcrR family transcriptional regulator n=1 Tax=Eisenbergiella porci TaxID=2652274 RepID=UPI002A7ED17B|nr:TetR/AcrR family transcriptional regulator [Eisenbergiella porci]